MKRGTYHRTFPKSYVHPPTESLVDGPCSQGARAHRRAHLNPHNGLDQASACGALHDGGGFRALSYYAAIAAGAKPCRDPKCFPTHLASVQ